MKGNAHARAHTYTYTQAYATTYSCAIFLSLMTKLADWLEQKLAACCKALSAIRILNALRAKQALIRKTSCPTNPWETTNCKADLVCCAATCRAIDLMLSGMRLFGISPLLAS
ncbi:hypothetical protein T4D_2264 [Trichinella pseudospiralis]|uniref:Uncharacterized protein n=1 Tax=Trichinella pseudospiralis TaxID=6337 RepID=A0A0V1FIC4_TRIPS|nr:hypothetical protein T4D_2264 [Trichinella pseudospiralis]